MNNGTDRTDFIPLSAEVEGKDIVIFYHPLYEHELNSYCFT